MANRPKKAQIPKLTAVMAQVAKDATEIADTALRAFAEREAKGFQRKIRRQDFRSFDRVPLQPSTLARKEMLYLDLRTMMATEHYVNSIQVIRRRTAAGINYYIGFGPNAHARNPDRTVSDALLNDVANAQEFGAPGANLPARPHWGPYLQEMVERATVVREKIVLATTKLTKQRRKQ